MKGYRDDALFDDGIRDPKEVAYYETAVLGNIDVCEAMISYTSLTEAERSFLQDVIALNEGGVR